MTKIILLLCPFLIMTNVQALPRNYDTSAKSIGLYPASQFQFNDRDVSCEACGTPPQALWYFKNELIVIPTEPAKTAGFDATKNAMQDIENAKTISQDNSLPPLVWIASKESTDGRFNAKQTANGYIFSQMQHKYAKNTRFDSFLFLTDKIATNLSFWDDKSAAFFDQKDIVVRGQTTNRGFMARTIWPTDFKLDLHAKPNPLASDETLRRLIEFENGGAKSAFTSRLLWERATDQSADDYLSSAHVNQPVLALILNGAQGDDDEAHGGHFAIATGRVQADGGMNSWLVNNYYNLASNSEKGIIAAPTPLDNYFADVNSGQSYYRPSYMLVAVFKKDTVPARFQAATNRVYNHFYRNDFVYDHSRDNCAGVSIDTLRQLGWNIPERGVESQLKAIAAYFFVAAKERSLTKGRAIYDYLNTEKTRLYPAQAFDAIGTNMLQQTRQLYIDHNPPTAFTKTLSDEIEAIYFVRMPQIPSSRAFGRAPIYGFDEYTSRVPPNPKDWVTAPATPNPFPETLKDGLALKHEKVSLVPIPVALTITFMLALFIWLITVLNKKLCKNQ